MPGLWHASPEAWLVREPVAVDHRDLLEMAGQDLCGQQTRHPCTHHDGVGALPAGGVAAANRSGCLAHPPSRAEESIGLLVGTVACAWRHSPAVTD
jgi:hypothetical protein